jgi:PTH1 family peptidyl-tRNA hydrolase
MPSDKPNQVRNPNKTERENIPSPKAVIGLGNPGVDYENTYHNIGFNAVDWLKENYGKETTTAQKSAKGYFEYCKGKNLIWIKSLVFMNESGAAVKRALRYFNLRPEEILIIHDDSDLEIGQVKLSWNRGSAGHKGIESVIKQLGTRKLWRLRIGIRSPSQVLRSKTWEGERKKASEFVLRKIRQSNEEMLLQAFKDAAKKINIARGR